MTDKIQSAGEILFEQRYHEAQAQKYKMMKDDVLKQEYFMWLNVYMTQYREDVATQRNVRGRRVPGSKWDTTILPPKLIAALDAMWMYRSDGWSVIEFEHTNAWHFIAKKL